MTSNIQMEKLWQRYQEEGVAHNMTMQEFCSLNNVAYNSFEKYLSTRRNMSKVCPVNITDVPQEAILQQQGATTPAEIVTDQKTTPRPVRILVSIKMTNGLHISRGNLSYRELHALVEKLEVLC